LLFVLIGVLFSFSAAFTVAAAEMGLVERGTDEAHSADYAAKARAL
jgi:hypothetical protein